jgi:membrane dipeptidase
VTGRRRGRRAAIVAGAGAAAGLAIAGPVLDRLVARMEGKLCPVRQGPPYRVRDDAAALHATLDVADLHADSLLFGRDLLVEGTRGHLDVPRMRAGNLALQVFAAAVKTPRNLNIERNDDRSDEVTKLALAARWPVHTWRSLIGRALYLAARLDGFAERSAGGLRVLRTRGDLEAFRRARAADREVVAGLLAIEGAHALGDDPANVDVVADAGYRMISPAHFFDTAFGGSAHGLEKGGLTAKGRDMIRRMEARGVIADVAHASAATIDDILAMAARPVVASHTGVRGTSDNARNLTDDQVRGIAVTGGLVGIGFWDTAVGGPDAAAIARAIRYAIDLVGPAHVALGSDFDGAVPVPFDASGMAVLTEALLDAGLDEDAIRAVMGANVMRVLEGTLPEA